MSAGRSEAAEGPLTIEEFQRLPEEDAYRLELVRGRVVREPRPAAQHGFVLARLCRLLGQHVDTHRLGHLFVDVGVIVSTDPPTVRGPDLAFVAANRLPSGPPARGFLDLAPNLCIEVVSPSNTAAEIREKVREYLGAGTAEVWVVDPQTRSVIVHSSRGPSRTLSADDELDGGEVLPGFRLRLRSLFATW
ncbi:MAG: Uma2 family endonuclease [Gemmatimonadetes bacterium]|nr:Uma2 family endonuclease [Gemmatimonadota bacterium]